MISVIQTTRNPDRMNGLKTPRVALVSSGLGNVHRGFEVSTARWFDALTAHTNLDVHLITGGPYPGAKTIANIPRDNPLMMPFLKMPFVSEKQRWELAYGAEQLSFFWGLLVELIKLKPDVLWIKDVPLAHTILFAKKLPFLDYKVIFANGGAFRPSTYECFDHIQQLHPNAYDEAVAAGVSPAKMDFVSNCIDSKKLQNQSSDGVRARLGLSDSDWIVTCTAAWNRYHKRIDYLIEEVAALDDPSVKLILFGVPEADIDSLKRLGEERLGSRIQWLSLPPEEVAAAVKAADVFVLPSLNEGLGNALIEAAIVGAPIVCHPYPAAKYILQDPFWMTDLSKKGALTERLREFRSHPPARERLEKLRNDVAMRFSDRKLAAEFERMVDRVINPEQIREKPVSLRRT